MKKKIDISITKLSYHRNITEKSIQILRKYEVCKITTPQIVKTAQVVHPLPNPATLHTDAACRDRES